MKNFFKQLLSKEGTVSSKITMGIILLINAIVYSYVKVPGVYTNQVLNMFLFGGAALLGVSIASDVVKNLVNKDKESEK